MIGTQVPHAVVLKIIETVSDPFLITALVVVFLMFLLLRRNQRTFDDSLKEVYTELRSMSNIMAETVATNKVLTDIIVQLKRKDENNK